MEPPPPQFWGRGMRKTWVAGESRGLQDVLLLPSFKLVAVLSAKGARPHAREPVPQHTAATQVAGQRANGPIHPSPVAASGHDTQALYCNYQSCGQQSRRPSHLALKQLQGARGKSELYLDAASWCELFNRMGNEFCAKAPGQGRT